MDCAFYAVRRNSDPLTDPVFHVAVWHWCINSREGAREGWVRSLCWCEEVLPPTGVKLQSWSTISLAEGCSDAGRIISITKLLGADKSLLTALVRKSFVIIAYSQFKPYWQIFKLHWWKSFLTQMNNHLSWKSAKRAVPGEIKLNLCCHQEGSCTC